MWTGTGFSARRAWQSGAVAPSPYSLVLAGEGCYLPPSTWAAVGFRHQMAGLVIHSSIKSSSDGLFRKVEEEGFLRKPSGSFPHRIVLAF